MANTTLKKNAKGYSYKYTDIAEIHEWLESMGYSYYQYIEPIEGNDYIITVPIIDGKEMPPRRGCKVIIGALQGKSNPAQEQGSGLTYARRYSLLMAFGLATSDDDAACLTREEKSQEASKSVPSEKEMKEVEKKYIDKTKQDLLMKQCEETGVNPVALCDKLHVPNFAKITEKQFYWMKANWTKEIVGATNNKA